MGNIIFWCMIAPIALYVGITSFIDIYKQQKEYRKNGHLN